MMDRQRAGREASPTAGILDRRKHEAGGRQLTGPDSTTPYGRRTLLANLRGQTLARTPRFKRRGFL
jgi:hypothetical protein